MAIIDYYVGHAYNKLLRGDAGTVPAKRISNITPEDEFEQLCVAADLLFGADCRRIFFDLTVRGQYSQSLKRMLNAAGWHRPSIEFLIIYAKRREHINNIEEIARHLS